MTFDELPKHIQAQWESAKPLSGGGRRVRTFHGIGAKPGGEHWCPMSESSFLADAHLRLEKNRGGRFTPQDVAAILAVTQKWDEQTQREFLWHLHRDIRAGRICIIKDAHLLERNCAIDGDKHSDAHDLLSAKEITRWLESQNAPYKFTSENFSDAPTSSPSAPAPVGALDHTSDTERRLALLRELGGSAKYMRNEWRFTGIVALVAREKVDGRKRCDEKTIRADLKEAAQAERDSKNAGFAAGLGQR